MGARAHQVTAVGLSREAWEPFGWLPLDDTDPRDGMNRLAFDWDDAHLNVIGHSLTEVAVFEGGLRCDALYRHDTHTQVLMPLDADAVVVVAPAASELADASELSHVEAFLLRAHETIVLHKGTWHWGPYPVGATAVRLLNVQGLGYQEDNRRADLAMRGLSVEVLVAQ